ncbi:MAG: AAA family ATPase [Candidatus Methanomethylophilaceae archaeon]|nr:AAA family ATPase [Candidatus Methanomethylophilaceae archaeon]
MKIAIYGKGGIGKSTIASNLSYSLSKKGYRVVQIGCDPKSDSTRPLLKGRHQRTVTEYIRTVPPSKRALGDIVIEGSNGVMCIEAGGPKPGTGCAGKGIISMFSTLERMGAGGLGSDFTLYDVLGDVVCGGFSVPMRPEHSDTVIIVTSGEYMSLFAANNIMKGSRQFEKEGGRVAGLVLNRRGLKDEDALVDAFSEATGVPVLGRIDRSDIFRKAEAEGLTVCEYDGDSTESSAFMSLAETICGLRADGIGAPTPLTDLELDSLYSEGAFEGRGSYSEEPAHGSYSEGIPVFAAPRRIGKGPVSAVLEAGKVADIPIVVHGTSSCGYTMLNEVSEERMLHLASDPDAVVATGENLVCTDMTPESSVMGGNDALRRTLEGLLPDNKIILVTSTCLPGMIGDDCTKLISDLEAEHPGCRILYVDSNRVDSGFDAHMEVIRALAGLIDPDVQPCQTYLNVVDDNFISFNRGDNRRYLSSLLADLGLICGPGFLSDCSVDDIIGLRRYGKAVLCEEGRDNLALKRILEGRGIAFMDRPLPRGYRDTVEWIRELDAAGGDREAVISRIEGEYAGCIGRFSGDLSGKRVGILSWNPREDLWMVDSLADCGCEATVYTAVPGDYGDERAIVLGSREEIRRAAESSDAVVDCMGAGFPGSIPGPETWLSHRASMDLIRSVWGCMMSCGSEAWKGWSG